MTEIVTLTIKDSSVTIGLIDLTMLVEVRILKCLESWSRKVIECSVLNGQLWELRR